MFNAYSFTPSRNELVGLANELAQQLGLVLDITGLPEELRPRYRISPRQMAPIV